jgi:hypothetical protein
VNFIKKSEFIGVHLWLQPNFKTLSEEVKRTAQNKELAKFMAERKKRSKGKPTYTAAEARKKLGVK